MFIEPRTTRHPPAFPVFAPDGSLWFRERRLRARPKPRSTRSAGQADAEIDLAPRPRRPAHASLARVLGKLT